jgi:hypothetical protein
VIQKVNYAPHRITYRTFDQEGTAILRLNFKPAKITAGSSMLEERKDLQESGYTLQAIGSDYIVQVKHRGSAEIVVQGNE